MDIKKIQENVFSILGAVPKWKYDEAISLADAMSTELISLNNSVITYKILSLDTHKQLIDTKEKNEELLKKIELLTKCDKHSSLENFKEFLKTIEPKKIYYNFGKGNKQVHTIFANALKEQEVCGFANSVIEQADDWSDADGLVYNFSEAFSELFPTVKYYDSDIDLYGLAEYWALPSETIKRLDKGKKAFDCDDVMVLKYACLHYLLERYFPSDVWRLRGFIVDLWSGGGHAILGWVSKKFNDWIAIETTFLDTEQTMINNYKIRDQLFYQIRYSFDDAFEYEKI